jgi:hypothetical protein
MSIEEVDGHGIEQVGASEEDVVVGMLAAVCRQWPAVSAAHHASYPLLPSVKWMQ